MQQLRRVTDQVFNRRATDRAAEVLTEVRNRAGEMGSRGSEMARSAYDYAMNHRKASAAVVLGAGVAAALIWMLKRNGGFSATRKKVLQRVRGNGKTRTRQAA